jgi:hypothetical protein
MFVRYKKNFEGRIYLQIVESYREKGKSRQRVLCTLGRLDLLQNDGSLESISAGLSRFSEKIALIGECRKAAQKPVKTKCIGPVIVFEKLWQQTQIYRILKEKQQGRKHEFSLERAIFLTVLHRLCVSGSDRAAEHWKQKYAIAGAEKIDLHHLYRAMAWLGEELEPEQQEGRTPFSPRCVKDEIEEALFNRRRDLFSGLALVFFDTTSIYFEGEGGEELGERGHNKDHRPDLKQMVVGIVLDQSGNPLCSEMWPGNTADVKTLVPIAGRLKRRFGIERVCVVADRGMISEESKSQITQLGWQYILGVRMRRQKIVKEEVLSRAGRYEEVHSVSVNKKDPAPLKVKEVIHEGVRYIVCVNETEVTVQQSAREAIVSSLREQLKKSEKQLIGNKGYRKYLTTEGGRHFVIDEEKIKEEARYDGKWVLTTNTDLPAAEVAMKYKQLWTVEAIFRTMKTTLQTRPVYHKCDETIRGHVFCSFLALVLRKEMEDRLSAKGVVDIEWAQLMEDLEQLQEVEVEFSGKRFILRSECCGQSGKALQAIGASLPPTLRKV